MNNFFINEDGWLNQAHCKHILSPHFNQRPENSSIDTCVLHNISLPPKEFGQFYVDKLFLGTLAQYEDEHPFFSQISTQRVSAHFFISRQGEITQYVSTLNRAWHAGKSLFNGRENCNDFSIGIEINGSDHLPYTLKQYQVCAKLLRAIMQRHGDITPESITTHSHIAPQRKTDPGPAFNLYYLHKLLGRAISQN